jgi:hypothetical protein
MKTVEPYCVANDSKSGLALRCYVCGEVLPTDESFNLVTMVNESDRVFILDNKCLHRLSPDGIVSIKVRRDA